MLPRRIEPARKSVNAAPDHLQNVTIACRCLTTDKQHDRLREVLVPIATLDMPPVPLRQHGVPGGPAVRCRSCNRHALDERLHYATPCAGAMDGRMAGAFF
jgi:hypothetical protein